MGSCGRSKCTAACTVTACRGQPKSALFTADIAEKIETKPLKTDEAQALIDPPDRSDRDGPRVRAEIVKKLKVLAP